MAATCYADVWQMTIEHICCLVCWMDFVLWFLSSSEIRQRLADLQAYWFPESTMCSTNCQSRLLASRPCGQSRSRRWTSDKWRPLSLTPRLGPRPTTNRSKVCTTGDKWNESRKWWKIVDTCLARGGRAQQPARFPSFMSAIWRTFSAPTRRSLRVWHRQPSNVVHRTLTASATKSFCLRLVLSLTKYAAEKRIFHVCSLLGYW